MLSELREWGVWSDRQWAESELAGRDKDTHLCPAESEEQTLSLLRHSKFLNLRLP